MPPFISASRFPDRNGQAPEAETAAREIRRLRPMAPFRSYTVILIGLLIFTIALVVFLLVQARN
jgi:hypothetical protein